MALSRAGAVAVVMPEPGRPRLPVTLRIGLVLAGSALISLGVAGLLWTGLGPGPLDILITAISGRWSIPITFVVWGMAGVMISLAWALGRRPGIGTLLLPFVSGALLPWWIRLLSRWTPSAGVSLHGVAAHVAAISAIGLGAGAVLVAGFGAGMGELLAAAASDRAGRPEPLVRTGIELTWLALGVTLGGVIGLGTVLVTLLIGPAVRRGHRVMERAADAVGDHRRGRRTAWAWVVAATRRSPTRTSVATTIVEPPTWTGVAVATTVPSVTPPRKFVDDEIVDVPEAPSGRFA